MSEKKYPSASNEIAQLLGLEQEDPAPSLSSPETEVDKLPESLPGITEKNILNPTPHGLIYKIMAVFAGMLPYLAVFAVGLLVYYFFFANPSFLPNFGKEEISLEEQQRLQKQADYEQLKKDESAKYLKWIAQFYFDISDSKIIEPEAVAKNGLTNFENYLLQLNPKNYDTLQNGKPDGENVLLGTNPKTGRPLSDRERDVIAKYFNVDVIRKRLGFLPASSNSGTAVSSESQVNAQTPPAEFNNKLTFNTEIPGRLEVPAIGVNAPIIWTKNSADVDVDLRRGIVHYPGTPLPGNLGTSYISGHSSNYAWVKADFNKVFAKMDELPLGATFKITVVGPSGKNIWLHYVVVHKQEFDPGDQDQFTNTAESIVALSTCWPINTNQKRLVAFGKFSRIEYE